MAVLSILFLPWSAYTGYFREHQYGMSNQSLGAYLREWAIGLCGLQRVHRLRDCGDFYRLVRRVRERWIWWASGVTALFMLFVIMVEPVFIAPIFNDYNPLPPGEVRYSILTLAHETKIPVNDVFWFDASEQTKRISANVSGLAGTTRIALNDNLLNGTSLPEIRAVMGHEMGHYRLHHGLWLTLGFTIALGIGYFVVNRVFGRIQRRRGERWGVRDLADPAGVPLAMAILMIVLYLLTPVTNTMIRTAENQADAFGLEAAREPHGFASVAMRLNRKLERVHRRPSSKPTQPAGRVPTSSSITDVAENTAASGQPCARNRLGSQANSGAIRGAGGTAGVSAHGEMQPGGGHATEVYGGRVTGAGSATRTKPARDA